MQLSDKQKFTMRACPPYCDATDCEGLRKQHPTFGRRHLEYPDPEPGIIVGPDGEEHEEWMWRIVWTRKDKTTFMWWTYEHQLEAVSDVDPKFPDEVWLT